MERHKMRWWLLKMVRDEMLEAGLPVNDRNLRTMLETMRDTMYWNPHNPFKRQCLQIINAEIFYLYGGRRKKERRNATAG